jgi:hypothetical protein
VGLLDRFRKGGPGPGSTPVHIDEPAYDSWDVLRDFEDVVTARSWHQTLSEAGIEAVLTSDWPLDRFGRGDIALRVPHDRWVDAEDLLSGGEFQD